MKVKYIAPFAVPTGFARAQQDYMAALHAAGVDLTIQPITDANSDDLEGRYTPLLDLLAQKSDEPHTHVVVSTIPEHCHEFVTDDLAPPAGVKRIAVTTWETDRLPAAYAETLDANFDAIVVPSKFTADAIVWGGVARNKVHVIPHCFDPLFWWWYGAPEPKPTREHRKDPYTFYSIGTWEARKAPVELLKAYFSAFRASDNVRLRLVMHGVNNEDVVAIADSMRIDDLPRVEFIENYLNEMELRALHYTSDCYVSLSRGEAWGLGAFEAAIVGNPVIVTGFSGWKDYLDEYTNKHYVDYLLTPAVAPIGGFGGDQSWAEPGVCHAKQLMRDAMKYDWNRRQARSLMERFSYKAVGASFRTLLEGL